MGESIAAGADVVCFSGDKLLGGPQAGIIVGTHAVIRQIRAHPLLRALRADKLTYAALGATLRAWALERGPDEVPVARMIATTREEIARRANALAAAIATPVLKVTLIDGVSTIGGGSAPGSQLPTCLVALDSTSLSADALSAALRRLAPPVVGRIEQAQVVLDLRTVPPEQDATLAQAIASLGHDRQTVTLAAPRVLSPGACHVRQDQTAPWPPSVSEWATTGARPCAPTGGPRPGATRGDKRR